MIRNILFDTCRKKPKEIVVETTYAEVPASEEDFEEIVQTVENGVVVDEARRTVQQEVKSPQNRSREKPTLEPHENFETQDIDEEEKGIDRKVQRHYMKTRNKKELFQEQNSVPSSSIRDTLQRPETIKVQTDPTNNMTAGMETPFDPEESSEIIMFEDTSRNNTKRDTQEEIADVPTGPKPRASNFTINTAPDVAITTSPEKGINSLSARVERDSPGPNRDMFTNTIEK